ncbi:MAG: nuclear transport factor 2 family protein [Xanthomonadaceae bacterium]|nr:nuclear transport factor 2 family protein [Xanthomonadaceae bacterium]
MKWILLGFILIVIAIAVWLFLRPVGNNSYVSKYQAALQQLPGSEIAIGSGLDQFSEVYRDLARRDLGERVQALYAETLYFNDTLVTFRDRGELGDYMATTAARLNASRVTIDQVLRDGHDVFVRWSMHYETGSIDSTSIGMSHLRFDENGRIVLHQDFWDSASGLYRHLPIIGPLMARVDAWMHR